ncbi:MAG: ROK family protein [Candidatus Eisenbacteria bacterium]
MRIGIDLGGTKIEGVALDERGAELARQRIATPRDDYEGTLRALAQMVFALEAEVGRRGSVGVGTPGAISPATGRMKNCNSTWLNGRALKEDLETRLRRVVRLANDANCFALSEAIDGAGRDAEVVFGVILGTGCGGGGRAAAACSMGRTRSRGVGHNALLAAR